MRTDSGFSLASLLRASFTLTAFLAGITGSLLAQDPDPGKKTIFESMSIDESGHVCYVEALDENPLNRLEYRTDGKDVLYIYVMVGPVAKTVEVTDLNNDKFPDLIHVEWVREDGSVVKTNFYRGPAYREHLRRHLQHALTTTQRHIIKDRPEEKARAVEIEVSLKRLEGRAIGASEVGLYSHDKLFQPSAHKDIRYAFIASDTLCTALRSIVDGDVRVLSRRPEIVPTYRLDIDILLGVDPAVSRGK